MITLEDLYVDGSDHECLLGKLNKYGIAIVKNYISQGQLNSFKKEFVAAFNGDIGNDGCVMLHDHPLNKGGKVARFNGHRMAGGYPAIHSVFCSDFVSMVT